jgi:hypothetical protein
LSQVQAVCTFMEKIMPEQVELIDEIHFRIDPSLRDMLPATTPFELELLEIQLVADGGPRDALVVWDEQNVLVDGHRRYDVCKRRKLPFTVERVSFKDRNEAVEWMLTHQVSRRNLLDHDKAVLTARLVRAVAGDLPKVEAAEKVSEAIGQSKRTTYRQLEYAEAYKQMPHEWQQAIADRDVKCPQKYAARIAELPYAEAIQLLDEALEAKTVEPLQKRFPDNPTKATRAAIAKAALAAEQKAKADEEKFIETFDPDSPNVVNVDKRAEKELIVTMLDDSQRALSVVSHSLDLLFGGDGLNASSSWRKREADSHVHGINIVLKDIRDSL